jgi:hypothetical protein
MTTTEQNILKEMEQIEFYINYINNIGIFKKIETLETISKITGCHIEYLEDLNTKEKVEEISNILFEELEKLQMKLEGYQLAQKENQSQQEEVKEQSFSSKSKPADTQLQKYKK